jgi:site-specific DNA-methyltransferase (adenine-specific)
MIYTGNCLEILPQLRPASVALLYFDPPFNTGMTYPGYVDSRPRGQYLFWLEQVLDACNPLLQSNASIWVQCGQTIQADLHFLLKQRWNWRNTVIWHYTFGPQQRKKFTPSWQALHWFTVHPKHFTFNDEAIRVPSARQTKYNDKRANPVGKIPDDVWTISRICGTFKERSEHPCQTPLELAMRVLRACTNPGDLVLDPMLGTGTLAVASALLECRFVGMELCADTAEAARLRLENELAQMQEK